MSNIRPDKDSYYLDIAKSVASRGTCLRRNYGAVIVKDGRIISTGYNGAPVKRSNCCDLGYCTRQKMNIPRGQRYELCRSVHAEANAIIQGTYSEMVGSTLYLYGWDVEKDSCDIGAEPCSMCKRMILNAGISRVVTVSGEVDPKEWVENDESLPQKCE